MPTSSYVTPGLQVRLAADSDVPVALRDAFGSGTGVGLLHLGAMAHRLALDTTLAWWRDFARHFIVAACGALDPVDSTSCVVPPVDTALTEVLAQTVPPMRGAEFVTASSLAALWNQIGEALVEQAARHEGGVQGYLDAHGSYWHVAGRICLHLAENKANNVRPFAFMATYARHVEGRDTLQHLPLSRALQEFAGEGNRAKLLALLDPLRRAASQSEVIRAMVDSGRMYQPLAWTPSEAYAFLRDAEAMQRSGVVVRLPDWWRRRSRPTVEVTVGDRAPSALGLSALVDFDLRVVLGGEELDASELAALLSQTEGLALVRGQWVEADGARLREVLNGWRRVEAEVAEAGVSFSRALRMLAGADTSSDGDAEVADGMRPEWMQVVAGEWLAARLAELRSASAADPGDDEGYGLRATLRPYQRAGVRWLRTLHGLGLGACLADDMGLGKTIQVIALLSHLRAPRSDDGERGVDLLVVPASLLDNWRSELNRFAPHLRPLIAHASAIPAARLRSLDAAEVEAHDVVITSYGTAVRVPWIQARRWRCVILDEAQAIKNPDAKQTRAIKALASEWRLALTGTPVENRLGDLWSLFDFLNPGLLGTARRFDALCRHMARDARSGYGPLRRLAGPYILRRLKTDRSIVADLPDKTEMTTGCLLTRKQAALYKDSVDALGEALQTAHPTERRGIVLAYLLRLKQICNHPSLWLGDGGFAGSESGKFQRLAELGDAIAERQEKVLVFTQFRTMTAPLEAHLAQTFGAPGLVLHGGTPVGKRPELVRRFQEGEAPFMVLSLKAGGTGLNLTAANHAVHFDRWWNPAVENQATDRAFRIGQKRNVLVHKFVCAGTVEERIDAMISEKQQLSDEVLARSGAETAITELSDREILDMVRLDIDSAVRA